MRGEAKVGIGGKGKLYSSGGTFTLPTRASQFAYTALRARAVLLAQVTFSELSRLAQFQTRRLGKAAGISAAAKH